MAVFAAQSDRIATISPKKEHQLSHISLKKAIGCIKKF
jgi:hypothetical protein